MQSYNTEDEKTDSGKYIFPNEPVYFTPMYMISY